MKFPRNLVGLRFGVFVVLQHLEPRNGVTFVLARCACGAEKAISRGNLVTGNTRSCGCTRTRHGHARRKRQTSEYSTWRMMRKRCEDPASEFWDRYGGRGIVVCVRWRESFDAFLADMGPKPSRRHSIDRIDNDGPYSPENCRWATPEEQGRNTSANRMITFRGRTQCVAAWVEETGLRHACIAARLRAGWTIEDTLTIPSSRENSAQRRWTHHHRQEIAATPRNSAGQFVPKQEAQ